MAEAPAGGLGGVRATLGPAVKTGPPIASGPAAGTPAIEPFAYDCTALDFWRSKDTDHVAAGSAGSAVEGICGTGVGLGSGGADGGTGPGGGARGGEGYTRVMPPRG